MFIMTNICLPNLALTTKDVQLFMNDPDEYIRKTENYFFNPLI
jgi:hypothetical protein